MGLLNIFKHPSDSTKINLIRKMTGMSKEEFDEKVKVDENGVYYFGDNTLLMGADVTTSYYRVKEGTELIVRSAFWGSEVESITLPESIHTIQKCAFDGAKKLREINIPYKISEICEQTFNGCESLQSITLPETCSAIQKQAFDNCKLLEKVCINHDAKNDLGSSPKKKCIGEYAFNNCVSLKEVELPEGVVSINDSAFKDCKALSSIALPSSLESIQTNAFWGCTSLSELEIPESVKEIHMTAMPPALKRIHIRAKEMKIAKLAFLKCEDIETIIVPQGCKDLYQKIFDGTTGPVKIKMKKNQLDIQED